MNTPYGLEIIENCVSCKLRKDKWFCGLSSDVLRSFSASSHLSTFPAARSCSWRARCLAAG
jgi:hypothetical protein